MGIENPVHLLFIAVIALIVLGPRRLPELTRAAGRAVREFREAIADRESPSHEMVVSDTRAPEDPQSRHPPMEYEPPVSQAGEPASVPAPPAVGEPVDGSEVDPGRTVRSGDAPDRRPL
ncbi:MAG TPA: twin-arginine translocase TatA/TatE family subunit [Solirubrobacteraceae bacterium]|jgi:TatA/E family protein of Tat protein translocase